MVNAEMWILPKIKGYLFIKNPKLITTLNNERRVKMRNYWKIIICVAITLPVLDGCKGCDSQETYEPPTPPVEGTKAVDRTKVVEGTKALNVQAARVLGRAYYLAMPLLEPSELANYVQQNRDYFVENGPAIRCASELGNKLIYQAVSSYSPSDYDRAYERSLEMGATMEMADSVANSIRSGNLELFAMGQELLWLAKVLPHAAEGDWTPFNTTGTDARITTRNYLNIVNSMGMMDPETLQIMKESMTQFQTLAEDQIVFLAMMSGVCE